MRVLPGRLLLSFAYYPLAVVLASSLLFQSAEHARAVGDAARLSTLSSKATALGHSVVEAVTLGLYDRGLPDAETYRAAAERAAHHLGCVSWLTWSLLGSALGFIGLLALDARFHHRYLQMADVQRVVWIALLFFVVGICSNALSFRATTQLPVLGEVVLRHQSKGILGTTLTLLESGDYFLGLIVLVFSILLPIAKVAAILFACIAKAPSRHAAVRLVRAIGKWSMLDVFVVAVVVAALTMSRDSGTQASIGPGVVFFAAYCLLSMLATVWLVRVSDRSDGIGRMNGNKNASPLCSPLAESKREMTPLERDDSLGSGSASGPPLFGLPWR